MAEKISVQIALEGGAEVQRQLADIGEAGQKAFEDISKAAEQAGGFKNLDPGVATAKLKEFGVTGVQEIGKIQKALQTAVRFETLVTGVQSVEAAFVALGRAAGPLGAALVVAFQAAAKATIAFANEINKASDQAVKLGLSLQQFKNLQADFEKLGVTGEAAASGFAKFQQELQKAAQADPGGQLAAFGLNVASARQQMDQFIAQLRNMPDGLERTNLAFSKMGEAGLQVVQGLRAAEGSMSADERKAYDLGQALERLKTAWDKLGSVTLGPTLTTGLDAITAAINQANQSFLSFAGTIAAGFVNPFELLAQQATKFGMSLLGIGQAGAQAGQQAAQGLQLVANPLTGMPELIRQVQPPEASSWTSWASTVVSAIGGAITTVGNFVSALAGISWDTIANAGVAAWNAIVTAVQGAGTAITTFISSLGSITWDAISSVGVAAWNAITGAINTAIDAIMRFLGLQSRAGSGGGASGKARGGLIGGRGSGTSDSNLAWLSRGEFVISAAAVRRFGAGFFAALNGGRLPGFAAGGMANGGPVGGGGDIVSKINQTAQQVAKIDANVNTSINMLNDIGGGMISLAQALQRLIETVNGIKETSEGTNRMTAAIWGVVLAINEKIDRAMAKKAIGGLIGGRGTGTSDSNLAWLSRGEFVITAAAVRRFGAGFFAALNAGMIPGFALGGLVPRPAFAGGGSVGGGNHVTIQFPGVPPVGGLRASTAVVEQLQKAAALAQVRSGGRKPSRYS